MNTGLYNETIFLNNVIEEEISIEYELLNDGTVLKFSDSDKRGNMSLILYDNRIELLDIEPDNDGDFLKREAEKEL